MRAATNDGQQRFPALLRLRGKRDNRPRITQAQGMSGTADLRVTGCPPKLIDLGKNGDPIEREIIQQPLHLQVLLRDPLSRIKKYQDYSEAATCSKVPLNQWSPRPTNRLRRLGVAVTRQINQIEVLVHQEKIKKLRPPRHSADARKPTAAQQAVD